MPTLKLRNPLRRDPKRPTLKQRAAALKATAARLIRNPKNTSNADADLYALSAQWDVACRLYDRRCEEQKAVDRAAAVHGSHPGPAPKGVGPEWLEWCRRSAEHRAQTGMDAAESASNKALYALSDIEEAIAALSARTLAGLQIKARVAERNSSIDVEWPQGLGDGLVADLLSLTGSLPAAALAPLPALPIGQPDPIFALIEANRAAEAVMDVWSNKAAPLRTEAERAAHDAAAEEQVRSWEAAFHTPPTTLAGIQALRGWIAWQIERHKVPPQGDGTVWADAYLSLHAALDLVPEASGMAEPDPPLVCRILSGWRDWNDQIDFDETKAGLSKYERLSALRKELIDAAEALPATPDNIIPKALASAWIEYVHLWCSGQPRDSYGTDGRLALDIDTAICGRLKTSYTGGQA